MTLEDDDIGLSGNTAAGVCCRRSQYSPMCRKLMVVIFMLSSTFLVIGACADGWLRLHTGVIDGYIRVYQDYSLWQVTQCLEGAGAIYTCKTRSYMLIDNLAESAYIRLDYPHHEPREVGFDKVSLVFSYSNIWYVQVLYMVGTLGSLFNLYSAWNLRSHTPRKQTIAVLRQNVITYNIIPAVLVFIPVIIFGVENSAVRHAGNVQPQPFGLVMAVVGGLIMFIGSLSMCIHTRMCPCPGFQQQLQDPRGERMEEYHDPVVIDEPLGPRLLHDEKSQEPVVIDESLCSRRLHNKDNNKTVVIDEPISARCLHDDK